MSLCVLIWELGGRPPKSKELKKPRTLVWVRTFYAVRDSPLLGSGGLHTSPTTHFLTLWTEMLFCWSAIWRLLASLLEILSTSFLRTMPLPYNFAKNERNWLPLYLSQCQSLCRNSNALFQRPLGNFYCLISTRVWVTWVLIGREFFVFPKGLC